MPTKGDGASNIRRADDRFLKDGPEQSMSELLRSYTARVDLGISDDIYLVGDNYLDGRVYDWYLFDYKGLWTEGDPFTAPLLRGKTNPADATGFIDDTLLTDAGRAGRSARRAGTGTDNVAAVYAAAGSLPLALGADPQQNRCRRIDLTMQEHGKEGRERASHVLFRPHARAS